MLRAQRSRPIFLQFLDLDIAELDEAGGGEPGLFDGVIAAVVLQGQSKGVKRTS